ncbi:hypothetical protein QLQ12_39985 [Actinoplanes sp. NEAU-A12]|uniref:Transposase DDE domain-containing protein n=1 Tax=Actinoplanes sandaracinus TaxID=3045177 RepID=A0ABT6WYH4_9ACTN|nr:hypothetical protein [Actinoplanes sandaracinus]MDI6104789.1 hypothetical protein [Actinoplanes sandaracinus]
MRPTGCGTLWKCGIKLAVRYEATLTIAATDQWLRALRNTL